MSVVIVISRYGGDLRHLRAKIGDKIIANLAGKKKLKNATDVADFNDATDFNDAITAARARRRLTGCLTSARVSRTHRSLQLSLHFCVRW